MSLFNKKDIVVASREATLQIIEQMKSVSKEVVSLRQRSSTSIF